MDGDVEKRQTKWFDLSRFGAALRVVPESPLRGVSITCFEINDKDLYQKNYDTERTFKDGASSTADAFAKGDATRNAWNEAREDLGFSGQPQTIFVDGGNTQTHRFYSLKTEFTLTDLKRLAPGLDASDLKDMLIEDIVLTVRPDAELSDKWAAFAKDVLSREAMAVWTPKLNPYAKPFAESEMISAANPELGREPFPLLGTNRVAVYHGMADKLDRAKYRQNALVSFYADLESATADGWEQGDLQQVDMPYAAPLWVTKGGQIIAVRDVRYAPEIMEISPEQYYRAGEGGIIVNAIRESKKVGLEIAPEVEKWKAWGKAPELLTESDALWRSISKVVASVEELRQRHPRLPSDVKHLFDGNVATAFGGVARVKPLAEITSSELRSLARTASRYVPMTEEDRVELFSDLDEALKRGHGLMAEQATVVAKQKLRELTETLQNDVTPDSGDTKFKHVDTGEKIGGARKDFSRRAMTVDDLESMNDMERKTHVMKKNVWASFDYEQMRDDGVTPQAAVALKYLKDKLNTAPDHLDRSGYSAEKSDAEYISAISLVRDAMAEVKTLDDFGKVLGKLYEIGRTSPGGIQTNYINGGTANQIQWGRDAASLIYEGHEGYMPFKIRKEIHRKVDGWGDEATVAQQWRSLIKPKREKSEADVEADKLKTENDRELHRPHLDRVQRDGEDWRGGRDITADDLIEHFGFRAVEFGNWLPQDERQQVLNMSFDSMCDLADALDIPPKGLSFDGDLAVAFGSRGRGGKHAALAHYEPARSVINLTRMNGAGALAHEWMHGLDFYLGGKSGYSSEQSEQGQGAMAALSQAMKRRASTEDEIYAKATENANRGKEYTVSWLYGQGPDAKQDMTALLDALFEKAKAVFHDAGAKHIETMRDSQSFGQIGFGGGGAVPLSIVNDMQEEIFDALRGRCSNKPGFTKVKDKVEGNLNFMVRNLALVCTVDAVRDMKVVFPAAFLGGSNSQDTDFHTQAKQLDKTRSESYWATTRELFARSGAAYVSDKLEAKGARSDYLVYGADEERYTTHPVGNPNPTGIDRQVLDERFNALIAEYRLECASKAEMDMGVEP